jgi:predicted tellurium resistance membrane protein TerC
LFAWSDVLTILLLVVLEGLLSADNAIVLAIMVLGLPKSEQQKALKYGLVGAFAIRIVTTLVAVYLIHLDIVKLIGAGYSCICRISISPIRWKVSRLQTGEGQAWLGIKRLLGDRGQVE